MVGLTTHAQDYGLGETAKVTGYDQSQTIYTIVGTVTAGVLASVAFIFFGLAMYAGLRWLTARGNQEFVEKAKSTLTAAIMGLVVTLSAYGLTAFIFDRLATDPNQALLDAGNTGPRVIPPDSCFNTVKDGLETDYNCGGSCDAKCSDGRMCAQNKDCQSNNCVGGVCMAGGSGCTDGVKNGVESDVDCGGNCPNRCGIGRACDSAADCVSGQTCAKGPGKTYMTCGGI
jgi:hypothetical protein